MLCSIEPKLIEQTISFHGHNCPGLAIGIRVSELAMKKLDICNAASPICVTETDMCGVDAIQFLTGCSFGKGNLIHKDWGKSAFTFYDRKTKKGFRALFKDDFNNQETDADQIRCLTSKMLEDRTTEKEQVMVQQARKSRIEQILNADLDQLFSIKEVMAPPVKPAKILKSLVCKHCGEKTMESRIRIFKGEYLCIPCFLKVEQKI